MDDFTNYLPMIVGCAATLVVGLIVLCGSVFTVDQMEAGIVTRFGKFIRIARRGLNFKKLFIETVDKLDLTITQVEITVDAKTRDDFLLAVRVAVQYQVDLSSEDSIKNAYFLLDDPEEQIESYVSNAVLGHIQGMTFDDAFAQQTTTSRDILSGLKQAMEQYGWKIIAVLIKELKPSDEVASALSSKISTIRTAEGEAEAKRQAGIGIANERTAIMEGLASAAKDASTELRISEEEALHLIVLTQYFDTQRSLAEHSKATVIFSDKSVNGLESVRDEIARGFLTANSVVRK
jgi:regulator of protease activity HflC (stomatin/prohibitin superfamily)